MKFSLAVTSLLAIPARCPCLNCQGQKERRPQPPARVSPRLEVGGGRGDKPALLLVRRVGRVWGKYYPVYSGISLSLVTHHGHLLVTLDPALPKSQFQGFKRHGPGHMTSFRVCISLLGSLCP